MKTTIPKNPQVLIALKGLYLATTSIIFLNFYYQIIALGIQDLEAFQNDSKQVTTSEEGIKILNLYGILSLGLLEKEFDHRNKYQKLIDELNGTWSDKTKLKNLYRNISPTKLPEILELLEGEDQQVKSLFFRLLTDLNDYKTLTIIFRDKDVAVGENVGYGLGDTRSEAKQAVPALIQVLKDENKWVRENDAVALGKIGPAAKQAIPDLIQLLDDEYNMVRLYAASALGDIGLEAVPALIIALNDEQDADVRRMAASALGKIGPEAKQAVPVLYLSLEG